eukprot:6715685-Ditylum_brightwellii.AAC.1
MFAVALGILHQTVHAYSHNAFTIGVAHDVRPHQFRNAVGMFVNTALVPFTGGKEGGYRSVKELHQHWR